MPLRPNLQKFQKTDENRSMKRLFDKSNLKAAQAVTDSCLLETRRTAVFSLCFQPLPKHPPQYIASQEAVLDRSLVCSTVIVPTFWPTQSNQFHLFQQNN